MKKGEGQFLKQHKVGYYAVVKLQAETDCDETSITTDCSGQYVTSQGQIEEATADGYNDWKNGAISGVIFAIEVANLQKVKVVITHIEGLTTDTNPIICAAAAARALWNALEINVSEETEKNLESYVLQSWKRPNYVPVANFLTVHDMK